MTDSRRVAVFGGSFNPPHVGHVLAVAYVLSAFPVDEVLVVPVFQHPFAKILEPFDTRLELCKRAMGWLPGVHTSAIEQELKGDSRTLYTLEALLAEDPQRSLRLVIGADVLAERSKWHRFDRVAELAPPIVLGRIGVEHPEAPPAILPDVSSTMIRERLSRGESVSDLVPAAVCRYIEKHQLYREPT